MGRVVLWFGVCWYLRNKLGAWSRGRAGTAARRALGRAVGSRCAPKTRQLCSGVARGTGVCNDDDDDMAR